MRNDDEAGAFVPPSRALRPVASVERTARGTWVRVGRYLDPARETSPTERMMLLFGIAFPLFAAAALLFVSVVLASSNRDFWSPFTASLSACTIAATCFVRYRPRSA